MKIPHKKISSVIGKGERPEADFIAAHESTEPDIQPLTLGRDNKNGEAGIKRENISKNNQDADYGGEFKLYEIKSADKLERRSKEEIMAEILSKARARNESSAYEAPLEAENVQITVSEELESDWKSTKKEDFGVISEGGGKKSESAVLTAEPKNTFTAEGESGNIAPLSEENTDGEKENKKRADSLKDIFSVPLARDGAGLSAKSFKNAFSGAAAYIKDRRSMAPFAAFLAACIVMAAMWFISANYKFGYAVYLGSDRIATVEEKQDFDDVFEDINKFLKENFGEEEMITAPIKTSLRLAKPDEFTDEAGIKKAVYAHSDKMYEMYVIYAAEDPICAVGTEEAAYQVIKDFKNLYTGGNENVVFSCDKELTVHFEPAPLTIIASAERAVEMLNGGGKTDGSYVVCPGDTLWSIAADFDTTVDELLAMNPSASETIKEGQILRIRAFNPVTKVMTKQRVEYDVSIPYETTTVEDSSMYKGNSSITQKGYNGSKHVVADVIKINGREDHRDPISETVTTEPITQVKHVGTASPPSGYGTGNFQRPCSGTITSRFGYRRSGFHKGIDIANSVGTPIRAADNGKVIFAGWDNTGFGYLVKINHQNGYISYYGHNSRIAVKVGQTVSRGDIVSYMGSTGNSSGPHCHFELYKNGALVNPYSYIF